MKRVLSICTNCTLNMFHGLRWVALILFISYLFQLIRRLKQRQLCNLCRHFAIDSILVMIYGNICSRMTNGNSSKQFKENGRICVSELFPLLFKKPAATSMLRQLKEKCLLEGKSRNLPRSLVLCRARVCVCVCVCRDMGMFVVLVNRSHNLQFHYRRHGIVYKFKLPFMIVKSK